MDAGFLLAIGLAFAFSATNGLHDASNAIATLVATRAARPGQAIVLATVFNMLGPLVMGAAVADTIGGIVTVSPAEAAAVIGSGLAAAVGWNMFTWYLGLPSSSGHALIGGLAGSALAEGGLGAVNWGGMDGIHPIGFFGAVIALASTPVLALAGGALAIRLIRRIGRRATRRWGGPVIGAEWTMSAALAFSHGANDAQKTVGVVAALLLADGRIDSLAAPTWVVAISALALTAGTTLGGWRIIRTVGRRIYRINRNEGLASQSASSAIIFGASLIGGPTATTQVVASSIVGIGAGRSRIHHVRWQVVREIGAAWVITIPAAAALAAITFEIWSAIA